MTYAAAAPVAPSTEPLLADAAQPPAPAPWTQGTRLAFRVAFLYFMLFVFCCGNGTILEPFPVVGPWIGEKLTWPLFHVSDFVSVHVLHFTGAGARFHPSHSGDTLANYVLQGLFIVLSVVGGLLWSAIAIARGNRRTEYQTLYATLRFLLRLTCGMYMLVYGLGKLFPLQMVPVSIAVLNEPVGNMSPMTFLWSMVGLNPAYEMVCGAAEVLGGVLILFRRTALAGALVSAFVMTNVLLYNLFFDVPVKLFAANLLLALLFITLPDVPALFRFFWLHQPAVPTGIWVPPTSRRAFRIITRTVELVFVLTFLIWMPIQTGMEWRENRQGESLANPLLGAWHVDAQQPASALESPEHQPITAIYIDAPNRGYTRSADGSLWRTRVKPDAAAHTVRFGTSAGDARTFTVQSTDADHAVLTAIPSQPKKGAPPENFKPAALTLTRIPLPSHYPLLDRGFHWVNEWGLER